MDVCARLRALLEVALGRISYMAAPTLDSAEAVAKSWSRVDWDNLQPTLLNRSRYQLKMSRHMRSGQPAGDPLAKPFAYQAKAVLVQSITYTSRILNVHNARSSSV
ncbi:unnamed protein product [Toxocara canis]|uniref:Transposase n=1 Tax=Toxocara canis TaxID=6265 RepID=A0A183UJL1_TOXCA|nr:unnamed protein product [Toxocara canis]